MAEVPDNPDRECDICGERDWEEIDERPPPNYPDSSDVVRHIFKCTNCDDNDRASHGRIHEENGRLIYSGNFSGKRYVD